MGSLATMTLGTSPIHTLLKQKRQYGRFVIRKLVYFGFYPFIPFSTLKLALFYTWVLKAVDGDVDGVGLVELEREFVVVVELEQGSKFARLGMDILGSQP